MKYGNLLFIVVFIFLLAGGFGCSGSYGLKVETDLEREAFVDTPRKNDLFERGTEKTNMKYEYSQGFGAVKGGHERYSVDRHLEYDSADERRKRVKHQYRITY